MLAKLTSLIMLMALAGSTWAALPYGPTEAERKLLPPWCQGDPRWTPLLGSAAVWNNHTCYGINRLNRYYNSRSQRERQENLQTALTDFNYSIDKLPPDFLLMPEIRMYRGITLNLMNRHGEAMADLSKAISMDPKLVRAYGELADLYEKKFSQRGKALEVVSDGLRHNPQAKSLQRRYTQLGGKPPFPAPHVTPPVETVAPTPPSQPPIEEAMPAPATKAQSPDPAGASSPSTPPAEPKASTTAASPAEAQGGRANSWCRFCPE